MLDDQTLLINTVTSSYTWEGGISFTPAGATITGALAWAEIGWKPTNFIQLQLLREFKILLHHLQKT